MKPELKKIIIEVAGKKLEFTPEEAKELKKILGELFGQDKTVEHVHHYDHWYYRPYWTWPTIYCGSGTGISGYTSATNCYWSGSYTSNSGTLTLTAGGATHNG